jgi:hypothetical protein
VAVAANPVPEFGLGEFSIRERKTARATETAADVLLTAPIDQVQLKKTKHRNKIPNPFYPETFARKPR